MRYFVQVLTMGEGARKSAAVAVKDGLIEDPDQTPGYIQGRSSDTDIGALHARGLAVRVLSVIEDRPSAATRGVKSGATGARPRGVKRPASPSARYVITLHALLTKEVRERLEGAGVSFLERLLDGAWAVRVQGGADLLAIGDDAAVASITPPPAAKVYRSAGVASAGLVVDYEAILFPDADAGEVRRLLTARGAVVHLATGRIVRFSIGSEATDSIGTIGGISMCQPIGSPTMLNDMARALVGVPEPLQRRANGSAGEGEIVGVADTGLDDAHPDFQGRIVDIVALGRPGDGSDPHGHGTHVTGTIAGDGTASNGSLAGVAPGARIFFQSLLDGEGGLGGLPADVGELMMQAYAAGVRVHNNSWGVFLQARYASASISIDKFVRDHPDFLVVVAAGNDGSCSPGANATPGFVDFPSMSVPATAKNVLTVGASRNARTKLGFAAMTYGMVWPATFPHAPIADEAVSGDPTCIAAFSARGPGDDIRIKPDVVAPGTDIASTKSASAPLRNFWGAYPRNPNYALMGGTSMACPLVAGVAVLIRQYLRQKRGHEPSAALLKAVIVNGAQRLSGVDAIAPPDGSPNFHQGFGRVNLDASIPAEDAAFALEFIDTYANPELELFDSGDFVQFRLELDRRGPFRLCLAWTDIEGRALQNALLFHLELPDGTFQVSNQDVAASFVFPAPMPLGPLGATFRRDPNNNVHVLAFEDAPAGPFVVSILADNLLRGPQGFAFAATGPITSMTRLGD